MAANLSFPDALNAEDDRLRDGSDDSLIHYSYRSKGEYAAQLKKWFSFFPREQFLIHCSETFFARPAEVTSESLKWLGVASLDADELEVYKVYNAGSYSAHLDPKVESELPSYYASHNDELFNLLGRRFEWRDG